MINRIAKHNGINIIKEKYKEEVKELQVELDSNNEPGIKEELVDVMIMCEQIKLHYGFSEEELSKQRQYKIDRTMERLELE